MNPLQQTASQRCHNCRRRRLRCDQTIPSCRKCTGLGHECLGYGSLFRWVGAVASRGKRAGKQSWEDTPALAESSSHALPVESSVSAVVQQNQDQLYESFPYFDHWLAPRPFYPQSPAVDNATDLLLAWESQLSTEGVSPDLNASLGSPDKYLSSSSTTSSAINLHSAGSIPCPDFSTLKLHQLVDPVMQNYNSLTRYYLHYFAERVAGDLVVYDVPMCNPFRNALQMCRPHGSILHVIVALSAVHRASLFRSRGIPTKGPLYDALLAKQTALAHVKNAVTNSKTTQEFVDVLIAVVFLINFGLVDSGRDMWKMHVVAAGRLMTLLQQQSPVVADSSILALRDYVMSDCLTYFILGSTLHSWEGTGADEVYGSLDIDSMLERAEANSYHSIPSIIMITILRSTTLVASIQKGGGFASQKQLDEARSLMRLLRDFDARAWATRISTASAIILDDPESREHMASAHRAAACIYLSMAIPGSLIGPENFAADIYGHLRLVSKTDMLFKGSVWPTFILGAQTVDREMRAWVEQRLLDMWLSVCPWGYVKTALEALQALWSFQDTVRSQGYLARGENSLPTRNWLSELKVLNVDYLVV